MVNGFENSFLTPYNGLREARMSHNLKSFLPASDKLTEEIELGRVKAGRLNDSPPMDILIISLINLVQKSTTGDF